MSAPRETDINDVLDDVVIAAFWAIWLIGFFACSWLPINDCKGNPIDAQQRAVVSLLWPVALLAYTVGECKS